MGRSRGIVYQCDGCKSIAAPASPHELPRGFHGGPVQVVADGYGGMLPDWWACSDDCLKGITENWLNGKGINE